MSCIINASTTSGLVMTSDLSGVLQLQNNGVNLPPLTVVPAFSAYNSSVQSIPAGTYTKIQFQTEEFDTANCFDSTTNYRFTPTVAGYYQVTLSITNGGATWVNGFQNGNIYKNGSLFKASASAQPTNGNYASSFCYALIYMNGTTDYIEGYVLSGGNSANWNTVTGQNFTFFQACLVRSA